MSRRALLAALGVGGGIVLAGAAVSPANAAVAWNHPFTFRANVTDTFRYRTDVGQFHYGLDLQGSTQGNEPVYTVAAGSIVRSGWFGNYGNTVEVQHADGYLSRYAHLRPGSNSLSIGYVPAGTQIGRVGGTGGSQSNNDYAQHLHIEIRINGTAVDPHPIIYNAPLAGTNPQEDDLTPEQAQMLTEVHRELVQGGSLNSPGYTKADIQHLKSRIAALEADHLEFKYTIDGAQVPAGVGGAAQPYWRKLGQMIKAWTTANPTGGWS